MMKIEVVSENDDEFARSNIMKRSFGVDINNNQHLFSTQTEGCQNKIEHSFNNIPDDVNSENKRESMASFKDSDINEGIKCQIPIQKSRF